MSRTLTTAVHTAVINGASVRFFKAPSGKPELPWHSYEDLTSALGLPRDVRRQLLRMTQAQWAGELRTVATPTGPVVIAPHPVAQGLLGAMMEVGQVTAAVETAYAMAGGEALKILAGDLPPAASVEFALASYHATNRVGGPEGGEGDDGGPAP